MEAGVGRRAEEDEIFKTNDLKGEKTWWKGIERTGREMEEGLKMVAGVEREK